MLHGKKKSQCQTTLWNYEVHNIQCFLETYDHVLITTTPFFFFSLKSLWEILSSRYEKNSLSSKWPVIRIICLVSTKVKSRLCLILLVGR